MRHQAKVHLGPAGRGTVELDGVQLTGIRAVTIKSGMHEVPQLSVDLLLMEADIEGEMRVVVPDRTRASLIALGWIPPLDSES